MFSLADRVLTGRSCSQGVSPHALAFRLGLSRNSAPLCLILATSRFRCLRQELIMHVKIQSRIAAM
jgi:hypothetical protein